MIFSLRTLGPGAWLLCAQYFLAEQIARAGWLLPYSARSNYISDLGAVHCVTATAGAICSPLHAVMNGSFMLQGALIVTGAVLGRRVLPVSRALTLACALLVISGFAVALVGVFPEDVSPKLHYRAAAVHFLGGDVGMLVFGAGLVAARSLALRRYGWMTLACGVVGAVGLGLLGARVFGQASSGAIERVAAYPLPLWFSLMGAALLAMLSSERTVRPATSSPPPADGR